MNAGRLIVCATWFDFWVAQLSACGLSLVSAKRGPCFGAALAKARILPSAKPRGTVRATTIALARSPAGFSLLTGLIEDGVFVFAFCAGVACLQPCLPD